MVNNKQIIKLIVIYCFQARLTEVLKLAFLVVNQ